MEEFPIYQILWIEDGAIYDMPQLAAPVYMQDCLELTFATDIAGAIEQLTENEFDAVIFDLRLPPGDDLAWIEYYSNQNGNKVNALLGFRLLEEIFERDRLTVIRPILDEETHRALNWLKKEKVGILSVESKTELEKRRTFDVDQVVYVQKTPGIQNSILVFMIEKILRKNGHSIGEFLLGFDDGTI
ncbi:MAG: hypothetical protein JW750_05535 [Anaerolineaceae bacterium]|nr:hypothetical protein [Anaerolineaceae bacterium]